MNFYEIETSILRIFPNINLHEVVKIENEEVGQILMKYGAKGTDLKDFQCTFIYFENILTSICIYTHQSRSNQRTIISFFNDLFIFHHNELNQPAFSSCSLLKSSPGCQKS